MIVRYRCQTSSGTRSRRNGQMINSGSNSPTAEIIASPLDANSTLTS